MLLSLTNQSAKTKFQSENPSIPQQYQVNWRFSCGICFLRSHSVRWDPDIGQDSNLVWWSGSMITRSKLVEQLRDYQIRSQHKWPALTVFSPKPILSTRTDAVVSIFWALLFIVLLVSSYRTLYLKYYWISFIIMCLGILIPIRLRISRQSLARKRDRRFLLPLSM